MKRNIFVIALSFVLNFGLAQHIIDYELKKSYTKEQLQIVNPLLEVKYDVDLYLVTYTSKKINNLPDTASGIIAVPMDKNKKFPTLTFGHGTVGGRSESPSRYESGYILMAVLAGYGYNCLVPDLIGLGTSKGVHPYLHPESEAWACTDMIYAAKEMASLEGFNFNDQNFITGYSQGGHVAMAASEAVQADPDLELTASAPMSGPYSLSREMAIFILSEEEYDFCGYVGSVFLSTKYSYPDLMQGIEIEDAFLSPYSQFVRAFEREEISLWDMNQKMLAELSKNGGKKYPKRMFKQDFLDKVVTDPQFPLNVVLKRMDVYDWAPQSPMEILYCKSDEQVSYRNAIYADSVMNANGAPQVVSIDVYPLGSHSSCISFAFFEMIDFFSKYQQITPVGVPEINEYGISVYPNPVRDMLNIDLGKFGTSENIQLILTDINGRSIVNKSYDNPLGSIGVDLSQVNQGLLYLQLISSSGVVYNDVIVND